MAMLPIAPVVLFAMAYITAASSGSTSSDANSNHTVDTEREVVASISSDALMGNRGIERIDVSIADHCGSAFAVFERAELIVHRQRYGVAQFISMPAPGCTQCSPLEVGWYHEPTGHLSFDVIVYRAPLAEPCTYKPDSVEDS